MSEFEEVSGPHLNALAEAISSAIFNAINAGMDVGEVSSVTVAVAADYYRGAYGDAELPGLASVVAQRGKHPLPADA